MTTQTKVTMLQDTYGADGVKYLSNTAYQIDDSVAQILIKNGLARWESGGEASSTVVEPEEQNMVRAEVDPVTGGECILHKRWWPHVGTRGERQYVCAVWRLINRDVSRNNNSNPRVGNFGVWRYLHNCTRFYSRVILRATCGHIQDTGRGLPRPA